jgi:hypothetical protein
VIAESRNINNDAVRHSVEALLELKKAQELAKQGSQSTDDLRALGGVLSPNHGVVSVLTDLNRSWTFYWYAKPKTKEAQEGSLQAQTRERRRTGGWQNIF